MVDAQVSEADFLVAGAGFPYSDASNIYPTTPQSPSGSTASSPPRQMPASPRPTGTPKTPRSVYDRSRVGDSTPSRTPRDLGSRILSPISPNTPTKSSPAPTTASPGARAAAAVSLEKPPVEGVKRLVIRKLVLENFKSYAGRQEIGPFNTNFSAVVGPNGSGKSNVIDSLLFVFGFRANKMRHGKLSNLIHKSEHHPNLQYCRVEVHFEDVEDFSDGRTEDVPDSSLIVSRQVTIANGSSYDINNRKSSFVEVTTLLKNRGIDLDHKRFLILQGEVESIAMMKPKAESGSEDGLLEYLEDIIGTSQYKPAIEEAEKAVDELRGGLTERQNRFDLAHKELGLLDEQRKAVETYMITSNQAALLRSSLHQVELHRIRAKLAVSEEQLNDTQAKLAAESARNESAKRELNEVQAAQNADKSRHSKAKAAMDEQNKRLKAHKVQAVKNEEKKSQLAAKATKLERTAHGAARELALAQHWLDEYAGDSQRAEDEMAETRSNLDRESAALSAIKNKLGEKTKDISAEMEELQRQVEPWRVKIQDKDAEVKTVQADLDFIASRQTEEKQKYDQFMASSREIAESGQTMDKNVKRLKRRLATVDEETASLKESAERTTAELETVQQRVESMRGSVASARDSRNSAQSQNKMVSELLKLRDEGVIPGLYGRLGSLGTIDGKYDVAVSTAAPGLDNFVVDTVKTGQKCIEILRTRNLGRGKFIVLERLAKFNLSQINTPENVPRLFDLVRSRDAKFLPAFYSVLSNTLVANDMDQARRVAYGKQRFRVVTLQGSLVEISGAMTGGGQVSRGKMASKAVESISLDALSDLEKKLAGGELDLVEAKSRHRGLLDQIATLSREKPALEAELSKAELSLKALESRMHEIRAQKAKMKSAMAESEETDKSRQAECAERIASLTAARDQSVAESTQMEAKIQTLQDKILATGGIELRMQTSKVQDLRDRLETLRRKQADDEGQRAKMAKSVKKKSNEKEDAEKELESVNTDLRTLEQSLEEASAKEAELEEDAKQAHAELVTIEAALEESSTKLAEINSQIEEMRSLEISLTADVERHKEAVKSSQSSAEQVAKQLAELTLYDVLLARDLRKPAVDSNRKQDPHEESQSAGDHDDTKTEEMAGDNMEIEPSQDNSSKIDGKGAAVDADVPDNGEDDDEDVDMSVLYEFSEHTPDELESFDIDDLSARIKDLDKKIEGQRVNEDVLEEYRAKFGEYSDRKRTLDEALAVFDQRKKDAAALKQKRLDGFMAGFSAITLSLKQMYKMITMTGNADLELVDSLDPFSEGISFSVMPPGKSWKNISNLSGGEKTLSSLALVFALHHYKPTPLYVMDEIDAALDFRNVSIIANYIKERTRNGQFIVISLRNNMFELADRLIGIYKVDSMTRSATLDISA